MATVEQAQIGADAPVSTVADGERQSEYRRLGSLDALRGFDMFWIIGGDALVHSLSALTGWSVAGWAAIQMTHAEWDGFRSYDLIFPLFIFIAGVAMPFSLSRRLEEGADRRRLVGHVARRSLILVAIGVVYNNGLFQVGLREMRYPSVLGRIGLAYFGAALIVLFADVRGQVRWLIGLLVGYWLILALVPVPGVDAGRLTAEGSLVGYVDRALVPGRLFLGVHDPEGLLSSHRHRTVWGPVRPSIAPHRSLRQRQDADADQPRHCRRCPRHLVAPVLPH